MKKILFCSMAIATVLFTACNSGANKENNSENMELMKKDSSMPAVTTDTKDIKAVPVTFTDVDGKTAAAVKEIINQYLHIKNALADDNGSEAASSGKLMYEAMTRIDKSLLTPEQKKLYEDNEDDLKEHAEHISESAGKIDHQREHFSMMSEDIYSLARAFGGGLPLYNTYCPMFNDGKGAMWLSETKQIRNPYMGSKMPTCGRVDEVIQ